MSTVSPASRRRRIVSKISVTTLGASPRLGSSRTRRSGFAMRARPIPTICCSPPLRRTAFTRARCRRRGNISYTRARVPSASFRARRVYAPSRRFASSRSTGGLLAEIRLDDRGVPDDLLRRALRDRAPLLEYQDPMRDAQDGPHDVLDDDGPEPELRLDPPKHLDGGSDLLRGEA